MGNLFFREGVEISNRMKGNYGCIWEIRCFQKFQYCAYSALNATLENIKPLPITHHYHTSFIPTYFSYIFWSNFWFC